MLVWTPNKANTVRFVMIDAGGNEVAGLGSTFALLLSKADGGFVASAGVKSEVGLGWYQYISTAAEADTKGPVSIVVTGAGCVQQNLDYMVGTGGSGPADTLPTTYATPECYDGDSVSTMPEAYTTPDCYGDDPAY